MISDLFTAIVAGVIVISMSIILPLYITFELGSPWWGLLSLGPTLGFKALSDQRKEQKNANG